MTTLIIPKELDRRLSELALRVDTPKDRFLLQGLERFLEDQEDYLDALDVSLRIESGEEKTIPYEEVLKQYEDANQSH